MFQDKYVFAQLTAFLNRPQFNNYVRKYDGNRYVKHFTCWNQLLAMMFGQLSNRESLRDLIVAFEAHRAKQYHLGLGREPIAKTTLATANQNRDYRIFEDFAFYMMKEACEKRATNLLDIPGKKYAFDSTTIPLCLSTFPWARFRRKKGGVKAHVLYDIEAQVPAFYTVTTASKHDSTAMSSIPCEPNAYYIFDRAYDSFKELYRIHLTDSFYVVRAKTNLKYKIVKWKRRMPKNVLTDAEVRLTGYLSEKKYPESFRLIRYYDEDLRIKYPILVMRGSCPPMVIRLPLSAPVRIERNLYIFLLTSVVYLQPPPGIFRVIDILLKVPPNTCARFRTPLTPRNKSRGHPAMEQGEH